MIGTLLRYQAAWLATVLGAAHGHATLGSVVGLLMIFLHLKGASHPRRELSLILFSLLLGTVLETILVTRGLIVYEGTLPFSKVPPWILILWAAFGATLNGFMCWFQSRLLLASLLGAVCGPLSWYAGQKLGALVVPDPVSGYLSLALGWAVCMPLLSWRARSLAPTDLPDAKEGAADA